jgi:hypothetical protein
LVSGATAINFFSQCFSCSMQYVMSWNSVLSQCHPFWFVNPWTASLFLLCSCGCPSLEAETPLRCLTHRINNHMVPVREVSI